MFKGDLMIDKIKAFFFLQQAKAAYAAGNMAMAKDNAKIAERYYKDQADYAYEYLDAVSLLQSIASASYDLDEYESMEPLIKKTILQLFQDKGLYYYAIHQFDCSEFYMRKGMFADARLVLNQAYATLSQAYGDLPIILYQYHFINSKYLYYCEDYYACIDSCLITNDLWIKLSNEQVSYEDSFLSMLSSNEYNINRMGLLNIIFLASSYGKINNCERGIELLQNICKLEGLDYYIKSAIDINLAELYARMGNFNEAARLIDAYKYIDYNRYPDLAACLDTIHFAINYSSGFKYDLPLRSPWISKISDTISADFLKVHRFNLAVAMANAGRYKESLSLSKGIGNKGLSLQMALYHELKIFDQIRNSFFAARDYYMNEISNIFTHYNEELAYNHLEALEYHISLCLGALVSTEFKSSSYSISPDELYEFYLNTKGISLEGSYILRHYSDLTALKSRKPVTVNELKNHIAADSILLEYALVRTLKCSYYCVFIVSQNNVDYLTLGAENEINELLDRYQDYLKNKGIVSIYDLDDLKTKLRRILILPVKKYLSNIRKLIIAPVGDLYCLPFESLSLNSTSEFGDIYQITYINIGRELAILQSNGSNLSLSDSLIIGNPKVKKLPDLKFAEIECKTIGKLIKANAYTGSKARIDLFYNDDKLKAPLLHIAAHGFFGKSGNNIISIDSTKTDSNFLKIDSEDLKNPMSACGLFLAEEYPLTASEISCLNLSDVKLCILSACYSGLGVNKRNEGIFGLRRAFFLAGCQNMLICLWSMNDFSGMLFIMLFYDGLIQKHLNSHEALQEAKLAMRSRTIKDWKPYWQKLLNDNDIEELTMTIDSYLYQNEDYIPFEHPYYWAGFQIIGNPVYLR